MDRFDVKRVATVVADKQETKKRGTVIRQPPFFLFASGAPRLFILSQIA